MKNYTKPNISLNAPAENICADINIDFNSVWHEWFAEENENVG